MPSIVKKALKKHGAFDIASVGFVWNGGAPYYTVSSTHPQKHDPYQVRVTADGTRVLDCTCEDFVEYRQFLSKEERCCKHMLGIQHLLDLNTERKAYEEEVARYRLAIMYLLRLIEELQHGRAIDEHS